MANRAFRVRVCVLSGPYGGQAETITNLCLSHPDSPMEQVPYCTAVTVKDLNPELSRFAKFFQKGGGHSCGWRGYIDKGTT